MHRGLREGGPAALAKMERHTTGQKICLAGGAADREKIQKPDMVRLCLELNVE